jgi:hypothetical protein
MTSRNLTTAMDAAIVAGKVRPVIFVEGSFHASGSPDEEFLRLWSGLGDFSWDSKTWTGAGKLLRISPLEESAEVKAVGFNVELSGLPPSLLSLALDNTRQGRPGRVWLGLMGREGYLSLPGVANNSASAADSAAGDITGHIEFVADVYSPDWSPASDTGAIITKAETGALGLSYRFNVTTGGLLQVIVYSAPTTILANAVSTVATGFSDGTRHWVGALRNSTTGDVKFYTSEDGEAWTQLGATVSAASGSIYSGGSKVEVGSVFAGVDDLLISRVYYAEVRNGNGSTMGGTAALVFDPSTDAHRGDTSFTSSATGEVWTINQSGSTRAEIVMDENHLLADPYLLRAGRMDYCNISVSGEDTRITAQYEDRLIDLQKPRERRYTDQDQRNEYPTDGGFRFVTSLQDKQLIWGGPGAAASPIAAPSYADTDYPEDNGRTARSDYD